MAPLLDRRNHKRSYRHLRSLIAVLDTVFPAATQDPNFLDRSLLMEGVSLRASPCDLLDEALGLQVEAAVAVRDAEFGDSVGLLVLTHAHDTEVATAAGPREGVFCDCIKASDGRYTRFQILESLDDRVNRQATADLFRSLVPPEYLLVDEDMMFHLSCVLLRGPGCSSEGALGCALYNLCNIGAQVLLGSGPINAVILGPDHDVAVLVYLDAQGTERIGRREPHLRQRQLGMYDSSLFPLPAIAVPEEASRVRRLLPPFVTAADYLGRVILLTEMDMTTCDAGEIAQFISSAGLGYGLEAVIVHRALGAVFVVFQSQSQSEMLLQVPQQEWFAAFKRPVELHLLQATPRQQQQLAPVQQLNFSRLSLGLRQWVNPAAFETLRPGFSAALAECPDHDFMELTLGLMRLAALSEPHALRRSYFPDRAVLLTRTCIYMNEWDLRTALSRYGSLDELVYLSPRRIALVIFTSWTGATRLLREPAATRRRLGFGDCRPAAADAGVASSIADTVLHDLLSLQSMLPAYW